MEKTQAELRDAIEHEFTGNDHHHCHHRHHCHHHHHRRRRRQKQQQHIFPLALSLCGYGPHLVNVSGQVSMRCAHLIKNKM